MEAFYLNQTGLTGKKLIPASAFHTLKTTIHTMPGICAFMVIYFWY
jgi:hypothetical protein